MCFSQVCSGKEKPILIFQVGSFSVQKIKDAHMLVRTENTRIEETE